MHFCGTIITHKIEDIVWMQMETMSWFKQKERQPRPRPQTVTVHKPARNPQAKPNRTATSMLESSKLVTIFPSLCFIDFGHSRHCVGEGESEGGSSASCGVRSRDYDVPLRIGTLFVVLVTSSIGVFAPMLLMKLPSASINGVVSTVIKQFGTGIIIATGFIHVSNLGVDTRIIC
jgi:hypothetical protein